MENSKELTKYQVQYGNEIIDLPLWCMDYSEEELEETKRTLYEEGQRRLYEPIEEEIEEEEIDYDSLIVELKKDGFTKSQIEEIIVSVSCGRTLDSSIQRVLGL